jgi:ABC-2 type transport system ATP-binding protein
VASLSAEHVVEFAVGSGAGLDERALQGVPGVSAAARRDGTWRVRVAELHRTVPALLAELHRRQVQLTELRTHSATLEDVFVELTGRHLRDE